MTDSESKNGGKEEAANLVQVLPRLTPEQVAQVSPQFNRQSFGPGENIINQGDPPEHFYIVIGGHAEVCHESITGHIETIEVRGPGEFFGETGLLKNQPRSATVRAPIDAKVDLLVLPRDAFESLIDESRGTEAQLAREMIQRLISLADYQE